MQAVMSWLTGFLLLALAVGLWMYVPRTHFIIPILLGACGLIAIANGLGIDSDDRTVKK